MEPIFGEVSTRRKGRALEALPGAVMVPVLVPLEVKLRERCGVLPGGVVPGRKSFRSRRKLRLLERRKVFCGVTRGLEVLPGVKGALVSSHAEKGDIDCGELWREEVNGADLRSNFERRRGDLCDLGDGKDTAELGLENFS